MPCGHRLHAAELILAASPALGQFRAGARQLAGALLDLGCELGDPSFQGKQPRVGEAGLPAHPGVEELLIGAVFRHGAGCAQPGPCPAL